jgi:hypothetical protein
LLHIALPALIAMIILGEEYKLWSCLMCSFLSYPVTSSPWRATILLRKFSDILILRSRSESAKSSLIHIQDNRQNYSSEYCNLWVVR